MSPIALAQSVLDVRTTLEVLTFFVTVGALVFGLGRVLGKLELLHVAHDEMRSDVKALGSAVAQSRADIRVLAAMAGHNIDGAPPVPNGSDGHPSH